MRRTLAAMLIVLLLVPELPARNNRGWENVKKLKRGTSVEILFWSGENLSGAIDGVSDAGIQLAMDDASAAQVGWLRDFDRASIRRVVRVREHNLPDSRRWMAIGAVAGGAVGVTAGAIGDAEHGNNGRWIVDGFAGAVFGWLVSVVALGAAGTVDVARGLHRREIVYEDQSHQPPQTP